MSMSTHAPRRSRAAACMVATTLAAGTASVSPATVCPSFCPRGRLDACRSLLPSVGFRNGNFANGLVSVTYELEDTDCNPAGGGFCCAPPPTRRAPPPHTHTHTHTHTPPSPHTKTCPHPFSVAEFWACGAGIPGSHKANVNLPDNYRNLDEYIDENVRPIGCKAGDCIIFVRCRCFSRCVYACR